MSRSVKPSKMRNVLRLNRKAVVILGGLVVLGVIALFVIKIASDKSVRRRALEQAKAEVDAGQVDLAMRNLRAYVGAYPNDVAGLEMLAKLLAESANSLDSYESAASINDHLLRIDPKGENRRETKVRLVKLYILHGDAIRQIDPSRKEAGTDAFEIRYRAALTLARQLIAENPQDATGHRLLALALDGLVGSGDIKLQEPMIAEYREAIRLDPGDAPSAERLAQNLADRFHDPKGAEEVLAALLQAKPDSIDVRMARYRYFVKPMPNAVSQLEGEKEQLEGRRKAEAEKERREAQAQAELEAARAIEPGNLMVLSTLANHAILRRKPAEARTYLDAIPQVRQSDLRVRVLRGMVEYVEQHHDDAIDQWRQGLKTVGGSDMELTWQLAFYLIQLGRLSEARPLVAQYQRLDGNDSRAMGRFLRALLEQRTGHPAKAIPDLEKARDRVPESSQSMLHLTLGRCYEAIGDEGRAMIAYRRATVLNPNDGGPHRAIARMLSARDPREGQDELERVFALTPNDPGVLFEIGRVRLGEQLAKPPANRDWRGLESILDRAKQIGLENDVPLRALYCDYLANSGTLEESAKKLVKLSEGPDGKRAEVWLAYSDVLRRLNRRDDAVKILDQAARPEHCGDHATLRIAKARILASSGRGKDAREALSKDRDRVPSLERPELSRSLGDLLRELGDREGARAAYAEWARTQTDSPRPGLTLLEFANAYNDDEAARIGLKALENLGGEQEPYGLAAKALDLLRPNRDRPKDPILPAKVEEASHLVEKLLVDAPQMPVGHLLEGMIHELKKNDDEAIKAYRLALKDNSMTPALPKLVDILTRNHKYEDIAVLKRMYDEQINPGRRAGLAVAFDQIAAAASLKAGDKERAEESISQIVQARPDDIIARANQARLLSEMGKTGAAEATLIDLVARRPDDPIAWVALVTYQHVKGAPGDALKTIVRARTDYKGERLDLLVGRCKWIINDIPGATKEYESALLKRPTDVPTLRNVVEFDLANGRQDRAMLTLRQALKADPSASWAARELAMALTNKANPTTWAEAWSLIVPGAPGSGEAPEDRIVRATVLARSPDRARRAEAAPALAALVEDFPASNPIVAEARVRLGQAFLEYNRPVEAANFVMPVADDTVHPNLVGLSLAVEALARSGRSDDAVRFAARLVELEPKSPRSHSARAWSLFAQNKGTEAAALINSSAIEAESAADGETVCIAFLDQLGKIGQPATAEILARRIAARWPRDAYFLGRQQVFARDFPGALISAQTAIDAGSVREGTRVASNVASMMANDPAMIKKAEAIIESGRVKDPSVAEVYVFLATMKHLQGQYSDEVSLYRQALERNPQRLDFLNNMAWTLSEGLNQPKEGLARVEELIRVEGPNFQYLDTRGVILTRLEKYEQAITDLEQAAPLDPSPVTYFHLARAYAKAGKAEKSQQAAELARKGKFNPATLDPTDRTDLKAVMGDS